MEESQHTAEMQVTRSGLVTQMAKCRDSQKRCKSQTNTQLGLFNTLQLCWTPEPGQAFQQDLEYMSRHLSMGNMSRKKGMALIRKRSGLLEDQMRKKGSRCKGGAESVVWRKRENAWENSDWIYIKICFLCAA